MFPFIGISETILSKFQANNVFTIANRNVEGQTMLYQSVKLTNGIWVLSELKMAPDNPTITVSVLVCGWVILSLIIFRCVHTSL